MTRSADASGQSPINKLGLAQGTIARAALHKVRSLALNAWKESTNSTPLTSAAGCLEFGAAKKTSICLPNK